VVNEIRKLGKALPIPPRLYHWRSTGSSEVDLILDYDGKLFPIEIKATSQPSKKHTRGFDAFRKTYPHLEIEKGLIIAASEKPLMISEDVLSIPWDLG